MNSANLRSCNTHAIGWVGFAAGLLVTLATAFEANLDAAARAHLPPMVANAVVLSISYTLAYFGRPFTVEPDTNKKAP